MRKTKKTYLRQWGILLPQVWCCYSRSEWWVEVELLEQVVPVLVLLLLVLLDVGDAVSHFCLPLGVLLKHVMNVLLCLFNGC